MRCRAFVMRTEPECMPAVRRMPGVELRPVSAVCARSRTVCGARRGRLPPVGWLYICSRPSIHPPYVSHGLGIKCDCVSPDSSSVAAW